MRPVKWEGTADFGMVDVFNLPLLKAQPDPKA